MFRRLFLSTVIVLSAFSGFVPCALYAQDNRPFQGFGVEANLLAGKIIKHSSKFIAPVPKLSVATDVNFVWQTYGKRSWHQRRRYPLIGLGMTYTDYGNNAVFGRCLGLYPNIQIPILRGEKFDFTLRIGDGIAYVTRKYQTKPPADTLNNAIGSNINDFAVLMMDLRYNVDEHWQLQFGSNFTHISNAHYKLTNLGVNMVGIHAGVRYFPITRHPTPVVKEPPSLKNRWLFQMKASIAYTESRSPGNPELPTYLGAIYASKRWRSKNKFFGGIDYAYHRDTYAFLQWCELYRGSEGKHSWDGGVFAGNEFLVGRLGLITSAGVYYKQTYLAFEPVYEKLGSNFYLIRKEHGYLKELFISAILTTHGFVAEYADFGVGIGL